MQSLGYFHELEGRGEGIFTLKSNVMNQATQQGGIKGLAIKLQEAVHQASWPHLGCTEPSTEHTYHSFWILWSRLLLLEDGSSTWSGSFKKEAGWGRVLWNVSLHESHPLITITNLARLIWRYQNALRKLVRISLLLSHMGNKREQTCPSHTQSLGQSWTKPQCSQCSAHLLRRMASSQRKGKRQ